MTTFLQADIFFFLTSIAVVVLGLVFLAAGIYLIKILRDIAYITRRVRTETDKIIEDVHDARSFVKKEVKRAIDIQEVVGGVVNMVLQKGKKRARKKT